MQKNCDLDYTLKSRKNVFGQLFFSLFSNLIFFGFYAFFQFFLMYFMTLVLIFSKFGMYLTYRNGFWGHFSWFLGRDINSTVWTRNGSKIEKQVMVFKGLKETDTANYACSTTPTDCSLIVPKSFSEKILVALER